jgi:glycerol-3-phosphate dehydrogenase
MKRDLKKLAETHYDLLIIGGGINGACAAWDAALRGLSVALVDKDDFGAATSANSMKIIHGGLRYLQQANISSMRKAIREQYTLMRIARHLVHPIPFLIPTYGHFKRGKELLGVALKMYDFFAKNYKEDKEDGATIPSGRLLSVSDCLEMSSVFDRRRLTGGAIWYECRIYNSERLTLSFLLSAAERGAKLANYAKVEEFITEGRRIRGVRVLDMLSGQQLELQARMVLNAAGPWAFELTTKLVGHGGPSSIRRANLALAVNLVTRKLIDDTAIGIYSEATRAEDPICGGNRFLFVVPWRGQSLVGTSYKMFDGRADNCRADKDDLRNLIDACNKACPALGLSLEDVCFYHCGLLPLKHWEKSTNNSSLASNYRIIDHTREHGIPGLISIIGVKYTTARAVAQKAIDLVFKRLGSISPICKTSQIPIYGGETTTNSNTENSFPECISEDASKRLSRSYGSRASEVVTYAKLDPEWGKTVGEGSSVLCCEILHAVRAEIAVRLADVVLRRTELGTAGCPPKSCLKNVAQIMARELGWDKRRQAREIDEVVAMYSILETSTSSA